MKFKTISIVASILLLATACNAKTESSTSVKSSTGTESTNATPSVSKAADPIPQPGGYSNIGYEKLQELLNQGVKVIDIRREDEWKQTGVIKGVKPITFFDRTGRINPNFVPEFTKLVKKDEPVALICRTGNRTKVASQAIAKQLGYKNVLNVTHGMMGWLAEKRPVVKY